MRANWEAHRILENIDSPKKTRPREIPYKPPTKRLSCQHSMEWAKPMRCNSVYAACISFVIQVPSPVSVLIAAHSSITDEKAQSRVVSIRELRKYCWSRLGILNSSGKSTSLGWGNHHRRGSPSEYQGKMPRLYAAISRCGQRSPPIASKPFVSAKSVGGKLIRLVS